jgi:hypothetical protein
MTTKSQSIPAAEALTLHTLVTPTEQGIASRVLARTAGGNLTPSARMPSSVPHAVRAPEPARMLLLMLRGAAEAAAG